MSHLSNPSVPPAPPPRGKGKRIGLYVVLILLVVGGVVGYVLYQNHLRMQEVADGFEQNAKMMEKLIQQGQSGTAPTPTPAPRPATRGK